MARKRNNPKSQFQRAADLAHRLGVFRPRDFIAAGFPREHLVRLGRKGSVCRTGRGLYHHVDFEPNENVQYVELAKRIPAGVVCLYSALNFHGIGTQSPRSIWLALPRNHARPRIFYPPLRLRRFSRTAYSAGIEQHPQPGGTIRVYSVAKTIADYFNYRHKFGLDVCIEALSDCLRQKRATGSELVRYAKLWPEHVRDRGDARRTGRSSEHGF